MLELKGKYIKIDYDGHECYGGNQRFSCDQVIKKCGCGIIAVLDTLLYLQNRYRWTDVPELGAAEADGIIHSQEYEKSLAAVKKNYFPVLYPFGTNGMALALGINRFFRRHRLPFHASWYPATGGFWKYMESMLKSDVPVVCAVGTNFPKFWEKNGLALQVFQSAGSIHGYVDARAHFVTVTGVDEEWMMLSSWGRKYYVKRRDYMSYARWHSNPLLCGMLYIRHK